MTPTNLTIENFIKSPWDAVHKGYRPSYLTCVSSMSGNWFGILTEILRKALELGNPLDVTLRELFMWILRTFLMLAMFVTFPISMWGFGYIQYMNIKHTTKLLDDMPEELF